MMLCIQPSVRLSCLSLPISFSSWLFVVLLSFTAAAVSAVCVRPGGYHQQYYLSTIIDIYLFIVSEIERERERFLATAD